MGLRGVTGSVAALIEGADRAAAAQNLAEAERLLEQVTTEAPSDFGIWMRLAGIRRALGKPRRALDAVHRALSVQPLDFQALVMRALIHEQLGDPIAGEAWGNALAQQPPGVLPPPLAAAVERGRAHHAAFMAERAQRLAEATAPMERYADSIGARRIARFRSNTLRETRPYHSQPTHFAYPALLQDEFHARERFPWLETVERATPVIIEEFLGVMESRRTRFVPYVDYPEHEPLDQWRALNRNRDWTAVHLWKNGHVVEENASQCPETMALLASLPQPHVPGGSPSAVFSILAPHTHIPPHVGIANTRLLCHLPLIVPPGCWLRVGATTREWTVGEAFVFDDTIEHEAKNSSDEMRAVLIFDLWHPDLSAVERDAVAALIGADGLSVDASI